MSRKYLGESFDIHGGGLENQFPHHECEIAQSEGATGKPFVRYWLHNNMVTVDGRKMGKSLGNFITLKDAFSRWDPEVIRFFILQSHYRSTLDFSGEAVEGAARGLEKLRTAVHALRESARTAPPEGPDVPVDPERSRSAFRAAMDDDFNSPQAIAVLFDLIRDVNQALAGAGTYNRASMDRVIAFVDEVGGRVLGLSFERADRAHAGLEEGLMGLFISLRAELRGQKLWQLADRIRDGLMRLGVVLEDRKDGTTWKKTS
jgi:cysteinyl-tRNA synthetase